MILTEVYRKVEDIPDLDSYHIETASVKSDDLMKSILRVTSDHGRDYGIRLADESQVLENGSAFLVGEKRLLVLTVIADEVIIITPGDIDEMGRTAHLLGNLHKPVQIGQGTITLLFDKVVVMTLDQKQIPYRIEKKQLNAPLQYADLSHVHSHDAYSHGEHSHKADSHEEHSHKTDSHGDHSHGAADCCASD